MNQSQGHVDGFGSRRKEMEKWSELALIHRYALDIPLDKSCLSEEPNTCFFSCKLWFVGHKNRKDAAVKLHCLIHS